MVATKNGSIESVKRDSSGGRGPYFESCFKLTGAVGKGKCGHLVTAVFVSTIERVRHIDAAETKSNSTIGKHNALPANHRSREGLLRSLCSAIEGIGVCCTMRAVPAFGCTFRGE